MPLVAEIKSFFKKTVILSGCISNGRDIASAMQMGADAAYMGTRFINTKESKAPKEYRDMIISSGANDVVYTAAISGVAANFLRPSMEAMGITEEMLSQEKKIDFGKELTPSESEAKAWATIWSAGQGVTNIHDSPSVAELVASMKEEFRDAIESQYNLLKTYE
jgi:nitronate monooxygenase